MTVKTNESELPSKAAPRPPALYSAPRRFDLLTILFVTAAYGALFGLLRWLEWPPELIAIVAGFITLVGLGQALLFGGKKPRTASMLTGMFVVFVIQVGFAIAFREFDFMLNGLCVTLIGGPIWGYFAGVFVGGVFFTLELLRPLFGRRGGN